MGLGLIGPIARRRSYTHAKTGRAQRLRFGYGSYCFEGCFRLQVGFILMSPSEAQAKSLQYHQRMVQRRKIGTWRSSTTPYGLPTGTAGTFSPPTTNTSALGKTGGTLRRNNKHGPEVIMGRNGEHRRVSGEVGVTHISAVNCHCARGESQHKESLAQCEGTQKIYQGHTSGQSCLHGNTSFGERYVRHCNFLTVKDLIQHYVMRKVCKKGSQHMLCRPKFWDKYTSSSLTLHFSMQERLHEDSVFDRSYRSTSFMYRGAHVASRESHAVRNFGLGVESKVLTLSCSRKGTMVALSKEHNYQNERQELSIVLVIYAAEPQSASHNRAQYQAHNVYDYFMSVGTCIFGQSQNGLEGMSRPYWISVETKVILTDSVDYMARCNSAQVYVSSHASNKHMASFSEHRKKARKRTRPSSAGDDKGYNGQANEDVVLNTFEDKKHDGEDGDLSFLEQHHPNEAEVIVGDAAKFWKECSALQDVNKCVVDDWEYSSCVFWNSKQCSYCGNCGKPREECDLNEYDEIRHLEHEMIKIAEVQNTRNHTYHFWLQHRDSREASSSSSSSHKFMRPASKRVAKNNCVTGVRRHHSNAKDHTYQVKRYRAQRGPSHGQNPNICQGHTWCHQKVMKFPNIWKRHRRTNRLTLRTILRRHHGGSSLITVSPCHHRRRDTYGLPRPCSSFGNGKVFSRSHFFCSNSMHGQSPLRKLRKQCSLYDNALTANVLYLSRVTRYPSFGMGRGDAQSARYGVVTIIVPHCDTKSCGLQEYNMPTFASWFRSIRIRL